MLDAVRPLPADPILGLIGAYQRDPNPDKVDLGAGVYRDRSGTTPIFEAVQAAERSLLASETTKSYVAPPGDPAFIRGVIDQLLGTDHPAVTDVRVGAVQAPGGCGALRLGAELIQRLRPGTPLWVSTPTWPNHEPLLGDAGLKIHAYPYYDHDAHAIDFDAMHATLAQRGPDDVVLLHGCCHNPCGADLTHAQWDAIGDLALERGFTPFIDIAYHGLGDGLDDDGYGVRTFAGRLPELLIAYSCSKNFGLYRERAGLVCAVTPSTETASAARTQLNSIARGIYSMPPAHGAAIVGRILADDKLTASWRDELDAMRGRLLDIRRVFAEAMAHRGADFGFIADERGLFSFLGISPEQVEQLRDHYSVYLVGSSRINVAGITEDNVEYLADAVAAVLDV
ncbi:MAG: aspartate/tyrosine/aromatic aminotransferase [Actinobacteria bacterium]|nr:aspartate/tyrosine/aromatic aminotransferase [Actinomycetota bacterium]